MGILGGLEFLGIIAAIYFVIRWCVWADQNPEERFSSGVFGMRKPREPKTGRRNGRRPKPYAGS